MGRTEGDEKLLERQDLADDPCTVHAIVASVRRLRKQQTWSAANGRSLMDAESGAHHSRAAKDRGEHAGGESQPARTVRQLPEAFFGFRGEGPWTHRMSKSAANCSQLSSSILPERLV